MASNDQRLAMVKIIAENTGWRGDDLNTAVAIMLRESGANPGAFNGNHQTGDESYGLFQLNTLGSLWKIYQGMGFTDPKQLLDPAANARAAYALYQRNGNTFHPWLGYRPGLTIAPQLPAAQQLVQQASASGLIPAQAAPRMAAGPGKSVPIGTSSAFGGDYGAPALSSGGSLADTTRELYGYLATYLEDPELGPILTQASQENWTPARLQGAIEQTDWWKNTQASVRTYDASEKEDPRTAEANVQARMADLQAQAAQSGFSIDATHLHDIARDSLRLGWSQQQLVNAIGAEAVRGGSINNSTTMQLVRSQAADYAVPLSDAAMNKWGQDIATGHATTEDYREYLVTTAKGQFAGLADRLDQGQTVKQLADPYIQIAAQTLGISPDSINLRDTKWISALNAVDSKGVVRAMTMDEWQKKIKSDPTYGWQNTKDAHDQAYALGATLGQHFGVYAGTS